MILHFEFRADADRWHVRVAETGFTRDAPNLMAYNGRGQVVSIGEHPREFLTHPARVVPIYDAFSFVPARTASTVRYYTMLAQQDVRHGLAHILDLFDRYELTLELPGYSEIAPGLRHAFELELYEMTFVRSFSINGRKRELPWNLLRWR